VRVCVGVEGAQLSQDLSSLITHIPGLKVFYPATAHDAKGMLNLALRQTDPVVFFESQKLYDLGEYFTPTGVPEDYFEIEEGEVAVRRAGDNLTIATLGPSLYTAMRAADRLQGDWNLSAEVIDLRFAVPLNIEPLLESVKKTGRLVLVSEAVERGSFLHTIATQITNAAFDDLDAPVLVVGARNHVVPCLELKDLYLPQVGTILDAIHTSIMPLDGYEPVTNRSQEEMARRSRAGV
jgi:2-oxoisovalerate dehydrogenase E1 component